MQAAAQPKSRDQASFWLNLFVFAGLWLLVAGALWLTHFAVVWAWALFAGFGLLAFANALYLRTRLNGGQWHGIIQMNLTSGMMIVAFWLNFLFPAKTLTQFLGPWVALILLAAVLTIIIYKKYGPVQATPEE